MTSKTQNNQPTLDKQITTKQAALALCWLEILLPGPVCVCVCVIFQSTAGQTAAQSCRCIYYTMYIITQDKKPPISCSVR